MDKYDSWTIKDVIKKISVNDMHLPAIQRKFVWEPEWIENLFDSIMRKYPIGTFLFWFLEGKKKRNYKFYKFIQEYHERDNKNNEETPSHIMKKQIIGVLDGQQRLGGLYIALHGSFSYKLPRKQKKNDKAFPKRRLFLNIFKDSVENEGDSFIYEFKFLTVEEAKVRDEEHYWFSVKEVLDWEDISAASEWYDNFIDKNKASDVEKTIIKKRKNIISMLGQLWYQLTQANIINFFPLRNKELDDVLDIFVRVNNGGVKLSKSDLLFSTIVANWEDGREEIENLQELINKKGEGFKFDIDFIMRSCLTLADCPVLFKTESFKKENIEKITRNWSDIEKSIIKAVDLLVDFGFNSENLTSQNVIIPAAYFIFKGGSSSEKSINEIRKYVIHALLQQIYGGQGDQILSNIRESLRTDAGNSQDNEKKYVLKQKEFNLTQLFKTKLSGGKSLEITDSDLDRIFDYKKGPYTFMILSLLYKDFKFGQKVFHQDHIHPDSSFRRRELKSKNISKENWDRWIEMKDKLPNLRLLEGKENESKNKTPIKDWIKKENIPESKFKEGNHIPESVDLEFSNFDNFYNARELELRKALKNELFLKETE